MKLSFLDQHFLRWVRQVCRYSGWSLVCLNKHISMSNNKLKTEMFYLLNFTQIYRGSRGREHMVDVFTTTCAYHH